MRGSRATARRSATAAAATASARSGRWRIRAGRRTSTSSCAMASASSLAAVRRRRAGNPADFLYQASPTMNARRSSCACNGRRRDGGDVDRGARSARRRLARISARVAAALGSPRQSSHAANGSAGHRRRRRGPRRARVARSSSRRRRQPSRARLSTRARTNSRSLRRLRYWRGVSLTASLARQRDDGALRAPRDRAAHVGQRRGARPGRQDELGQPRQRGVVLGKRLVELQQRPRASAA